MLNLPYNVLLKIFTFARLKLTWLKSIYCGPFPVNVLIFFSGNEFYVFFFPFCFSVVWGWMGFAILCLSKMVYEMSNALAFHCKLRDFRHEKTKKKRGSY